MKLQTECVPVHVLIFFFNKLRKGVFTQDPVTDKYGLNGINDNNEKCLPKHFQTFSDRPVPSAAVLNSHFLFFIKTRFNFTLSHKCGQSIVFFSFCCTPAL